MYIISSNSIIHPNIMGLRGKKSKASVEGDLNKSLPFCQSAVFRGLFGHGSAWALLWSVSYWTPPVETSHQQSPCYWQTQVFFMLMRNQKPSGWKPFVFMKAADTRSSSPDLLRVSSDPPRRKMILKHFQIKKSTIVTIDPFSPFVFLLSLCPSLLLQLLVQSLS